MPIRLSMNGREVRDWRARAIAGVVLMLVVVAMLAVIVFVVIPLVGLALGIAAAGALGLGGAAALRSVRRPRRIAASDEPRRALPPHDSER